MKIIYLTTIHGRHEIVKRALEHVCTLRAALANVCDLQIVAAMSPPDHPALAALAATWGVSLIVVNNTPVSFKWQAGLDEARRLHADADAVMTAGSDDFISEGYMRFAVARLTGSHDPQSSILNPQSFGPDRCWFLHASTGEVGVWSKPLIAITGRLPIGAGRCYTRKTLDRVAWRLWPFRLSIGLDTHSAMHLARRGVLLETVDISAVPGEAYIVDVKNGQNIHPWQKFIDGKLFDEIIPADDPRSEAICKAVGIDRAWWKK